MSLAEEHAVFGASTNQKSAEELIKEVGTRELRGQALPCTTADNQQGLHRKAMHTFCVTKPMIHLQKRYHVDGETASR
jgi:hypothetical protein